jgi:DNA-binding MarR family transcriptional regulator
MKYAKIPAGILCEPSLRLAEKVFLGLVYSFNDGGLRLGNQQLGQILGLNESNASRMVSKLMADGWIKITGGKSRWRRMYLASGDKVNKALLCSDKGFTLLLATFYLAPSGKQNNSNNIKEQKTDSFSPTGVKLPEPDEPKICEVLGYPL